MKKIYIKETPKSNTPSDREEVMFLASDGYPLSGTIFNPLSSVRGSIIVAGEIGASQSTYHKFASYASTKGFKVLTYDYRGINKSKQGALKGSKITIMDWAKLDTAGAIDWLYDSKLPLYFVGHSFGGQSLGVIPNHSLIRAAYSLGTGAGWAGYLNKKESRKLRLFSSLIFPLLVVFKGYLPWSKYKVGEDLPPKVFKDLRKWCGYRRYFFDDRKLPFIEDQFKKVKLPYVAATSEDDEWSPPLSRDVFNSHYRNCRVRMINIKPKIGSPIGHMGYFKEGNIHIWNGILKWFLINRS